ncbi:HAMP domain-containing sensor histidine kinase [Kiritimatiellaeota bacterium B1221]|nr:HAMP domain-containing sensor histidine kinase [Kiritimatiellaeota bacterium B1221]
MDQLLRIFRAVWHPSPEDLFPGEDEHPEKNRQANLIVGFTSVGGLFSIGYAIYYLFIGHHAGALAILCNSLLFLTLPWFCLRKGRVHLAALCFVASLVTMFTWLSIIEGGTHGHAVAWLATMPFCTQLLVPKHRQAFWISVAIVVLVAGLSAMDVIQVALPILYPENEHGWVTLVGYAGLATFMCALGFIVEYYRRKVMGERDVAERELKNAVEELTRLNLEKNEFLGIAAHDLSNPLTVINGYAELLRDLEVVSDKDLRDYSHEIAENSKRMQKIVQDILDVNTIESGRYPLNMEEVDLKPLFETCLSNYLEKARRKVLKITPELADVRAVTDAGALGQILDNLVSNALKYAIPGGAVRVSLFPAAQGVCFEVYNEGRGFSEEDKQNLFVRFAKLSTRPTAGEPSVGLGLSITHKIVEAMGGEITCESELNQGALFKVQLP